MSLTPVAPSLPALDARSRLFFLVLGASAVVKLLLAAIIPLTSDEAYFVIWGRFPDYGYYDHGAMTGWWLGLTLLAGDSPLLLRLPAVVTPLAGALLLRAVLRPVDPVRASLTATLFLLSPLNLLNVLITPDTPLLLFSLLAGAFAIRAVRQERSLDLTIAGLFLGLAFLAKYLAVLLGLAFGVYLMVCGGKRRFIHLLALLIGTVPGVAVNVIWNFNHGWTNVLFNAFTRNVGAHFSPASALLFTAYLGLLVGPVTAYFLFAPRVAGRRPWRETWRELRRFGMLMAGFAVAVPVGIFLALSLVRPVGLHWVFSFYPFFFLVLAAKFDAAALQRQIRPMIVYVSAVTVLGFGLLALPAEAARHHRSYNSLVLSRYPEEVLGQLASYQDEYTLVSPSYAQSAQLSFHCGHHVPVIGPGSMHGRQDDFITDFRGFDGRNLMVLSARAKDALATHPFFDRVESREVEVHGARLFLTLGRGFKFGLYRAVVLERAAAEYYRMPAWLAPWSRPAPFITRYGLEPVIAP